VVWIVLSSKQGIRIRYRTNRWVQKVCNLWAELNYNISDFRKIWPGVDNDSLILASELNLTSQGKITCLYSINNTWVFKRKCQNPWKRWTIWKFIQIKIRKGHQISRVLGIQSDVVACWTEIIFKWLYV
jgi:hypothetical protein